jgi:hypothetical protein
MTDFYGSSNSRYFLTVKGMKLTMYHEDRVMWETELAHGEFSIIGLGNNGCVVLKARDDVFLFRPGERPAGEVIKKLSLSAFQKMSAEMTDIVLNDEGSQLCILKESAKSKVSEKIFGALASVKVEKGLKEFELLVYDIISGNFQSLYRVVHPVSLEQHFKWAISRDFNFFLVGNPRKNPSGTGTKYSIIDTTNLKTARSFELEDTEVRRAMISTDGTSLLEASKKGAQSILIVTRDAYSFSISPPERSRIIHLGKGSVCFFIDSPSTLLAKAFDDKELCQVSMAPLAERNMEFGILFNLRDHVDLLYYKEGALQINRSELSTFFIEVKRFELAMAETAHLHHEPAPAEPRQPERPPVTRFIDPEQGSASPPETESKAPPMPQPRKPLSLQLPAREVKVAPEPRRIDIPYEPAVERQEIPEPLSAANADPLLREKLPSKVELYQSLETLKLRLVMGAIDEGEYREKKEKIEKFIEKLDQKATTPPEPLPMYKTNVIKMADDETRKATAEEEAQRQKIQQLLESLEERFILGEVNEASYRELKGRYMRSLGAIRYQASPSQISKDNFHSFGKSGL